MFGLATTAAATTASSTSSKKKEKRNKTTKQILEDVVGMKSLLEQACALLAKHVPETSRFYRPPPLADQAKEISERVLGVDLGGDGIVVLLLRRMDPPFDSSFESFHPIKFLNDTAVKRGQLMWTSSISDVGKSA